MGNVINLFSHQAPSTRLARVDIQMALAKSVPYDAIVYDRESVKIRSLFRGTDLGAVQKAPAKAGEILDNLVREGRIVSFSDGSSTIYMVDLAHARCLLRKHPWVSRMGIVI